MLEETRWQVFCCDPDASWTDALTDPLLGDLPSLAEFVGLNGNRAGQPFVLRSEGAYAREVNAFLGSIRMRGVAEGTRRKDAIGLSIWLGFLDSVRCCWADATADQVDAFRFWRTSSAFVQRPGYTVRRCD